MAYRSGVKWRCAFSFHKYETINLCNKYAQAYRQETCIVVRKKRSRSLEEKGYVLNTGCQYGYDTITKCTLALAYFLNRMIVAVIR